MVRAERATKTVVGATPGTRTVQRLAPEDVVPGIYVVVFERRYEVVKWWDHSGVIGGDVRKLQWTGRARKALPMRVERVCLPYVFVERVNDRHGMIDLRCVTLAKLDQSFGAGAFAVFRQEWIKRSAKSDCDDE